MSRLDRFRKLERQRPPRPKARRVDEPTRFADVGGEAHPPTAQRRSGGEARRFEPGAEVPDEAPLRLREDDGGQPFVRCRTCRRDNPVGASICALCDADLTTPAQRAYNEELWERHLREHDAYRQEAQQSEARDRQRDEEYQRAVRDLRALLGTDRDQEDTPSLAVLFRQFAQALAGRLNRTFPNQRERRVVVLGTLAILNLLALWVILALDVSPAFWLAGLAIQLVAILAGLRPQDGRSRQRPERRD